jgi:hypothetical protein
MPVPWMLGWGGRFLVCAVVWGASLSGQAGGERTRTDTNGLNAIVSSIQGGEFAAPVPLMRIEGKLKAPPFGRL